MLEREYSPDAMLASYPNLRSTETNLKDVYVYPVVADLCGNGMQQCIGVSSSRPFGVGRSSVTSESSHMYHFLFLLL